MGRCSAPCGSSRSPWMCSAMPTRAWPPMPTSLCSTTTPRASLGSSSVSRRRPRSRANAPCCSALGSERSAGLGARLSTELGKPVGEPLSSARRRRGAALRRRSRRAARANRRDEGVGMGGPSDLGGGDAGGHMRRAGIGRNNRRRCGGPRRGRRSCRAEFVSRRGGVRVFRSSARPCWLCAGRRSLTSGSPHGAPFEAFAWSGTSRSGRARARRRLGRRKQPPSRRRRLAACRALRRGRCRCGRATHAARRHPIRPRGRAPCRAR